MRRVLANPYGMQAPAAVQVVRVGPKGEFTHALNPHDPLYGRVHLCRSGIKNGNVPPLFVSTGRFINCYRCSRLLARNQKKYGSPLPPVG